MAENNCFNFHNRFYDKSDSAKTHATGRVRLLAYDYRAPMPEKMRYARILENLWDGCTTTRGSHLIRGNCKKVISMRINGRRTTVQTFFVHGKNSETSWE